MGADDASRQDVALTDCPPEVVDRLLWRTAQRILTRHAERLDGTCYWCGRPAPCDARRLAIRAADVACLPWHEAWQHRNEITGMLPVITAQLRSGNSRPDGGSVSPTRPMVRGRTRVWTRFEVTRNAPGGGG